MSKSLGNLVFVSRLRESGVDPMAIRLALHAHHYRSDWEWTDAVLSEAEARLTHWRAAVGAADAVGGTPVVPASGTPGGASAASVPAAADVLQAVRERLADDLDAPGALAAIDAWADAALADGAPAVPAHDAALIRAAADALLGIAL